MGGADRVLPLSAALSHAVLSDTIKRTVSSDYKTVIMQDRKDHARQEGSLGQPEAKTETGCDGVNGLRNTTGGDKRFGDR